MIGGSASLTGGVDLLERAISYTLAGLDRAGPEHLSAPTPCEGWDLRALLAHLNDSLLALYEAVRAGRIRSRVSDLDGDPVALVRQRARRLRGAWVAAPSTGPVAIADVSVTTSVVAGAGALEVAVHGWDVARACGLDQPIPDGLAAELRELAPLFITDADRPALFAAPVACPPGATPGERLLSFLGRSPEAGPRGNLR
ncbi:MAG TPA: TIGR03086 family metal-binding protein [Amycolatopsis sp.]|nr:TIGR03086 family metal-binding protein [Amycolatopsis sp.]